MISRANWSNLQNLDADDAVSTVNRYLPPVLSLIFVVLIGWQLAKIVWMLVPAPAAGDPVATPDTLVATGSIRAGADVAAIAAAHLFGIADADLDDSAPQLLPEEDLADTRLVNLTLKGTVASKSPEYSVALISDGGREQEVYVIGDNVAASTSLHAIYVDRVVLNENGELTNLKLPKDFENLPIRNARQTARTTRQASRSETIQGVVAQNLAKLSDVIRPVVYAPQGQPAGFRVYPGRDRKQFAALGLKPGDIIKDIDGQPLTDTTQALQIFQSLGTSDQVTVTVERQGQTETLVLKTSQLNLGEEQTQ